MSEETKLKQSQLKQYQALPLKAKVRLSEMRIHEWYEAWEGKVYIAISGKDSCTLADIVWSLYPSVPAVFSDTGNEMDSVKNNIYKMRDAGRPIVIVRPKITFEESLERYGYPVSTKENAQRVWEVRNTKSETLKNIRLNGYAPERGYLKGSGKISECWKYLIDAPFQVSSKCCKYLKGMPCSEYEKETGRMPFVGTLAEESQLRRQSFMKFGCNAFGAKNNKASRPLIFWTEQDILMYIKQNNVQIPDVYGDIVEVDGELETTGEKRTGCKFCLLGAHKDDVNRIQRLAVLEPESYRHAIEDLGYDKVMDLIGVDWKPVK